MGDLAMHKIGKLVTQCLQRFKLEAGVKRNQLPLIWEEVVGRELANRTEPQGVRNQVLYVKVESSSWMHQLHAQDVKRTILGQIDEKLGKGLVKDIRFVIGPVASQKEAPGEPGVKTRARLSRAEKDWIEEVISQLADPGLRQAAHQAMARQARTYKREVKR